MSNGCLIGELVFSAPVLIVSRYYVHFKVLCLESGISTKGLTFKNKPFSSSFSSHSRVRVFFSCFIFVQFQQLNQSENRRFVLIWWIELVRFGLGFSVETTNHNR